MHTSIEIPRTAAQLADELHTILQGDLARLPEVPALLQGIAGQLPALQQLHDLEQAS